MRVTQSLAARKRQVEDRLRNTLFRSKREQVSRMLVELVERHGERAADRWEIRLPLSHQVLAALTGTSRETVTVILGQLQFEGLIQLRRCGVAILDRGRLAAVAR